MRLTSDTQDHYTPDPGKIDLCYCGVCGRRMDVERHVHGPRTFVGAMSGSKSTYDSFTCPDSNTSWHKQIIALRKAAHKTPSTAIEKILLDEAQTILETREATKEHYGEH